MAMNSAVYSGTVRHRRLLPRHHEFRYRLFMLYLDLAELDRVFAGRWLWSVDRPNVVSFRRRDYLDGTGTGLDEAVRQRVHETTGVRPTGPIRLLTHPRYFGYGFNPISVYYCFDAAGEHVETFVAEVSNTPWKERHWYVLPVARPAEHGFHEFDVDKAFHVSPFMTMDHVYHWRIGEPGERLMLHLRNTRDGEHLFDATLSLEREPLDGPHCARHLLRQPFMTGRLVAAIYWQALRLWLKRIPLQPHPDPQSGTNTTTTIRARENAEHE